MSDQRYIFVSYSRRDADAVMPVVQAVREELRRRNLDLELWIDVGNLLPGQNWETEISRALQNSLGLIAFLSPAAVESAWIRDEIAAAQHGDRLVIPVLIHPVKDLPFSLINIQYLDLTDRSGSVSIEKAAVLIAEAAQQALRRKLSKPPVPASSAPEIAAGMAQNLRATAGPVESEGKPPDSVFLVHGHDTDAISEMDKYLNGIGVKTFILAKVGGPVQSLLQKFFKSAANARFAVVLLSADDVGASRKQYDAAGVGEKALQFRARQNVILELGFFYGLLGWENVFVLLRTPDKVYPNFERPSDIEGAVFDLMDDAGGWRESLADKLREAGFQLKKES